MIDRLKPPAFTPPAPFVLPHAKKHVLRGGVPVHYLDLGKQPLLKIDFIFPFGKSTEPNKGINYLTAKMLTEGTKSYTAHQISETLDFYGAYTEINPGNDYTRFTVYTLSRYLEQITPLLIEILQDPVFPQKELDILLEIYLNHLRINQEKTNYLASKAFKENVFGINHPYGRFADEEDLKKVAHSNSLEQYHKDHFQNGFFILVTGPIKAGVWHNLEQYFDEFKNLFSPSDFNSSTFNIQPFASKNIEIAKPDALQSSLRIGKPIIGRLHPDYIPLYVCNEILGGYFGSRLMQNVREEKGYTYGIHSSLHHFKHASLFTIGSDIIKEYREATIDEINKEIKKLQNEAVGSIELDRVINYIKGHYLSGLSTSFAISEKIKNILLFDLNYEYYDNFFDELDKVTPEKIMEVAQTYLDTDDMIYVSAGI
jgi:zinc protease